MKKLLLLFFFTPLFSWAQLDSLKIHFSQGQSAYEAGKYDLFLSEMLKANQFRAYYPPVIYNIAAGYALTNQPTLSVSYLKTFLSFNTAVAYDQDTDFTQVSSTSEFLQLAELKAKLDGRIVTSSLADSVVGTRHVESISYHKKSGRFFLGDVRAPQVYQLKEGQLSVLISPSHPEFYSVMGLDIDQKRNLLWICTSALPQMIGYADSLSGRSSIFMYDLKTNQLIHQITLKGGSAFGDLIVAPDGSVVVSDGASNRLWQYQVGSGLSQLADVSQKIANLQGLTFSEDGESIFMSDYVSGLYRLHLPSKSLKRIESESGTPFKGFDGLYREGNDLIGIENGSRPMRVVRFSLSENQNEITGFSILDQNVGFLDEPTQGMLVKDEFYYISNSPWGLYDKENRFPDTKPYVLQIRKVFVR